MDLKRTWRSLFGKRRLPVPDLTRVQPADPVGRVVISAMGPRGVNAWKTWPDFFYPPFAFELSLHGIETVFALTLPELLSACDTPLELVVIHVYNEDYEDFSQVFEFDRQFPDALIWNRAELGVLLGWKDRTHRHLTARGIAMPRLAVELEDGTPIFSNERKESKAKVILLRKGEELDEGRYNAEFVDTRRTWRGVEYFTSLRLLCVGRELVHGFVQVSPALEGEKTARAKIMPFDPELLAHFHHMLIGRRRAEIADLAARLGDALGPGFFAHDLIVESGTETIMVCESGYKFDHGDFRAVWHPVAAYMSDREAIFSPVQATLSGRAFLAECRRHGRFLHSTPAAERMAAFG